MQGPQPPDSSVQAARDLLGVASDADRAQVARAYRRQARRFHPDLSLEPYATERFWALQAAYHLALDAAGEAAQPDIPTATAGPVPTDPTPAAQVPVDHRDPTVVLATSPASEVPASTSPGRRDLPWLVAGPVHVQRRHHPVSGAGPRSAGEPS